MTELISKGLKQIEVYIENEVKDSLKSFNSGVNKVKTYFYLSAFSFISIAIVLFYLKSIVGLNKENSTFSFLFFLGILVMLVMLIQGFRLWMLKFLNLFNVYTENKIIILKNKNLTLDQIKQMNETMFFIKSKMEKSEFEQVLSRVKMKTGKDTDNAYFYWFLFENHEKILIEVKENMLEERFLSLKYTILNEENSKEEQSILNMENKKIKLRKKLREIKETFFFKLKNDKYKELEMLERDKEMMIKKPKNNFFSKLNFILRSEDCSAHILHPLSFVFFIGYFMFFLEEYGLTLIILIPLLICCFLFFLIDLKYIIKNYKEEIKRLNVGIEVIEEKINKLKEDVLLIKSGHYSLSKEEENYTLKESLLKKIISYFSDKKEIFDLEGESIFENKEIKYKELKEIIEQEEIWFSKIK